MDIVILLHNDSDTGVESLHTDFIIWVSAAATGIGSSFSSHFRHMPNSLYTHVITEAKERGFPKEALEACRPDIEISH